MSTTIIGPISQQFPSAAVPAMVELKRQWSDAWTFVPELEFVSAHVATAGHDLGACELAYRYGDLKNPWESTDSIKPPVDLTGCWGRISFCGQQGFQEAFVGRISGDGSEIFGSADGPAGMQRIEVLGPMQVLRKIHVGGSYWLINGNESEIDWVPSVNEKYGRNDKPDGTRSKSLGSGPGGKALGSKSGNRSENTSSDGIYLYGDFELWNYRQYAEYLLKKFVDEGGTRGPSWTLGGQCEILENFCDPIQLHTTQTVDHILRKLIPPEFGVDYKIVSTDDGFEVSVFALTQESYGWGGQSIPGNPDTVEIHAAQSTDSIHTTVARTSAQQYGTIRILGGRICVCASFHGSFNLPGAHGITSLGGDWNPDDKTQYDLGTGDMSDSPDLQEQARQREQFADVYRKYAVTPDWYAATGVWSAPYWDGQGNLGNDNGPMQQRIRSTLPWLPLETGVDYSTDPPVDNNPTGTVAALRLPQVWLQDQSTNVWHAVDTVGIGLSVLHDDLGFFLHATPNDLLNGQPWYNGLMIATFAYLTDQRLYCEQKISNAAPSDGVLELDASECQFWWLAPDTFLDTDQYGQPILSPSVTSGQVLRNDWARMMAKMAGALARHYQQRARAEIVIRGLVPWGQLLGQILTVVDTGGETQTISAPITAVHWRNGAEPTTVISTGFAHGD